MDRFSPLIRQYNYQYGDYKNIKLWDAVRYTNIQISLGQDRHRAWIDAEVMRRLWIWMNKLPPISNLLMLENNPNILSA